MWDTETTVPRSAMSMQLEPQQQPGRRHAPLPGESVSINNWNISQSLEDEVLERDKNCVYCRIQMIQLMPRNGPRNAVATWEHIINDARIVTRENIARCCNGCNSSKGAKTLADWLQSNYCKQRAINKDTVAGVVKAALLAPG